MGIFEKEGSDARAVFARRSSYDALEISVEAAKRLKTAVQRDLQHRLIGILQGVARLVDAVSLDVIRKGDPRTPRKEF